MAAPASGNGASGEEWTILMQRIEETGHAILLRYNAVDELLYRLSALCIDKPNFNILWDIQSLKFQDKSLHCLAKFLDQLLHRVEQQPSPAMKRALKSPIEALATDGILKNVDLNVKILVGSCICEIARVAAPEPPYEETKMRDVSDLLVTVIKSLSFLTGDAYRKASSVLATVSRCHLFYIMWDCDEAFIIEMFKDFLHLQTNHADNVISEMEQIMTTLLNAEAPTELFGILLNCLKKDNENLYPVSYKLAERVFNKCADMIKQRLPTAVRLSEVVLYDYNEVVARVLNAVKKLLLQDDATKAVGPSAALPLDPLKNDEAPPEAKDDMKKTIVPKETSQIVITQLNPVCHNGNVKAAHELNSESPHAQKNKESIEISNSAAMFEDATQDPDIAAVQSLPEELTGPVILDIRNENSNEESTKNKSSTLLWHVCDKPKEPNVSDVNCLQVKASDAKTIVLEESNAESASTETEHNKCDVAISSQQPTDLEKVSTHGKRGWKPNFLLKLGEGYDDLWVDSGKSSSDAAPRRRNNRKDLKGPYLSVSKDSLVESERIHNKKRSRKGRPRSAYHPLMEHENRRSSSSRMGFKKQRNCGVKHSGEKYLPKVSGKDNGEALVGSKIRVYWPNDNKFYQGSIISFDTKTKRYKVIYDDGDEEVLDLAREQFELVGNDIGIDKVQLSDDDTVTLYDLGNFDGIKEIIRFDVISENSTMRLKNALNSRPSTKKFKLASHVRIENALMPDGGRLEVVNSRTNLEQDQPIEVVNPAVLNSPGEKSRVLNLGEVHTELVMPTPSSSVQTSSGFYESVNPHRYQVKSSSILIRDAILKRYGDITANCLYKSQSMRESLLEVVCNVVGRLKNSVVTVCDIKAMTLEISDAADAKLDVSWLQQFVTDIVNEEAAAKTASDTRTTATLTLRAAQKQVEHRKIELAAAKTNVRDAKRRAEALKCVLEKIDTDLLDSVAQEKSWKKRLDELLMSQG